MTTRCNVIVREVTNLRKEVVLYQHNEGHPAVMVDILSKNLYEIHKEYEEHGDTDWFIDPGRVVGRLIVKSVPVMPEDVRSMLSKLDNITRNRLELPYLLGMPTMIPDIGRTPNCNYEYVVTLSEDAETNFRGYKLEVSKLQNNKKILELLSLDVNLLESRKLVSHTEN